MFASIGSIADRAFIVGFVLPVVGFLLAMLALFSDFPPIRAVLHDIAAADGFEKLTYLILTVWVLALVLQFINDPLYKMLEGYKLPLKQIAWLKRRQQERFDDVRNRFITLNTELKSLEAIANLNESQRDRKWEIESELYPLRQSLVTQFPFTEDMKSGDMPHGNPYLLPTRFGNAIRAFEIYSLDLYGADSIPLWLHLATVVPKDFQSTIEDMRGQVNCLVNIFFLALVVATTALARFVATWNFGFGLAPEILFALVRWDYLAAFVAAAAIVRISYGIAIERACAWGVLVKAAFDCYLPALAKQLGFRLPAARADQKAFWSAVSRRAIYHQPFDPKDWPTDPQAPPLPVWRVRKH